MDNVYGWIAGTNTGSDSQSSTRSSSPSRSRASSRAPPPTNYTTTHNKYVIPQLRVELETKRTQLEISKIADEQIDVNGSLAKKASKIFPIFSLAYNMASTTFALLRERLPMYTFAFGSGSHDHPLAHTETVVAKAILLRMAPMGAYIVDLFGKPQEALAYNNKPAVARGGKTIFAYVAMMAEKDYLRALSWGLAGIHWHLDQAKDFLAFFAPTATGILDDVVPGRELVWMLNHTLYYLTDEQIVKMLKPSGSRALAIVHRHQHESGSMFGGEVSYAKRDGIVEQYNNETLESYVHRDLSFLFESHTKIVRTAEGAYAWTLNKVTVETWIITLVAVPADMDERFVARSRVLGAAGAAHEMNEHSHAPSTFPHPELELLPGAVCRMVGGVAVVAITGGVLPPVKITCPELYDYLRTIMVGKPRDADRLADLFSAARTHVAAGSDFPGKKNFQVRPEDIPGHVSLAYIAGLKHETELLRSMACFGVWIKEHRALSEGGAVVMPTLGSHETSGATALALARRMNNARKNKDTFDAILGVFE